MVRRLVTSSMTSYSFRDNSRSGRIQKLEIRYMERSICPLPCSIAIVLSFTLVPATVFLRRLSATWGISSSGIGLSRVLEHRATTIPTDIPMFWGETFNGATSGIVDVDIRQKSTMAFAKMKCTYFTICWRKTISNTPWANLRVHELNENINDNIIEYVDATKLRWCRGRARNRKQL